MPKRKNVKNGDLSEITQVFPNGSEQEKPRISLDDKKHVLISLEEIVAELK